MNPQRETATLASAAVAAAAQHLLALRQSGHAGDRLVPELRPQSLADGWRIQQQVSALRDRPVVGWKCGLPKPDRWVVAPLHEAHAAGASVQAPAGPHGEPRIEPELAFKLQHALPPRPQPYTAAEVDAAVGAVHLAVEVLGCRYVDAPAASASEMLADSLWHQTLVLGPEVQVPPPAAFSLHVQCAGRPDTVLDARHADGNPRVPLHWLAEFLRAQGVGLAAGQVVITGTLAGVIECPFGSPVVLRYGELGTLALCLVSRQP